MENNTALDVSELMTAGKLSEKDTAYAHRAFEFLKLIDRHIRETSLISKYITLIQTIHYKSQH